MSFSSQETLYETNGSPKRKTQEELDPTSCQTRNEDVTGASALTLRQSVLPLCFVNCLCFLWGLTLGLIYLLNAKLQFAMDISAGKACGLQGAYFGAYLISPLTYSCWTLRRHGYRWTFVLGLCLYGVGSLLFWPSAVYRSFPGFCVSLFVIGSGLSTLETSINPYVANCGPPRLSELRLMVAQGVLTVGAVIAPILASRIFFKNIEASDLSSVQWMFVGLSGLALLLVLGCLILPIPEITDADMAQQAVQCSTLTGHVDKPLRKQYKLFFGVAAVFCFVGSHTSVNTQFINYAVESTGMDRATAADRYAIAAAIVTVGRFTCAGMFAFVRPRLVLLSIAIGVLVFLACAVGIYGEAGIALISVVLFFDSGLFPTTFTLTLRGLGRHSKRGASWLVAAVSGGAVFPALTGIVADHSTYHKALIVPLVAYSFGSMYPIYLNTLCTKELDGFRKSKLGYHDENGNVIGEAGDIETEEKGVNATPCPPV